MRDFFTSLWTDRAAFRAAIVSLVAAAGAYYVQPAGRPIEERIVGAVIVATGGGLAASSGGSNTNRTPPFHPYTSDDPPSGPSLR